MGIDLFAGIPVRDHRTALPWYELLLGAPSFHPNDVETVWELAPHRFVYIVQEPDRAGHAVTTVMVEGLDDRMAAIAGTGIAPDREESYGGGVRKTTYVDPDGNRFAFGEAPAEPTAAG